MTLDLKDLKELQLRTSVGRLFHAVMVFGKNECWWDEVRKFGTHKYVESADLLLYEKFFGSTGASGNSVSPFKIL